MVHLNTNQGCKTSTILKAGKFNVDIDHSLAEQSVTFDIKIMAVCAATIEEIAHGHAHGIGGHNH